jgi:hypothetical protein
MKKAIILQHQRGNRLANQLWNYISIYAYALEIGYECYNYCFFEEKKQYEKNKTFYTFDDYNKYFDLPADNLLNSTLLKLHTANIPLLRNLKLYYKNIYRIKNNNLDMIIYSEEEKPYYLSRADKPDKNQNIYFSGWMFRNPKGIEKYREQIKKVFRPKNRITTEIDKTIAKLKSKYNNIVGVHIRQKDYKTYMDGRFFFSQQEIRKRLDEYNSMFQARPDKTCFVICSDDTVETNIFNGLNIHISQGSAVHDLFLLARTNTIIGSDSTFGAFAAYYGNIPFIIFKKKINWDYYKNKFKYFENKYCYNVWY